jgi:hypothetical protein
VPFWQFFRNRLIGWIGHALLVQPSKTALGIFFSLLFSIFIHFFEYETIVTSSALSFGHSDPDLSSVIAYLKQRPNASAAAVPSSNSEALATSKPVRSHTIV